MRCHLPETVKIQLPYKTGNVLRFEDGIARVKVLFLEFLVIEENRVTVQTPAYSAAIAFVDDSPQFLWKSQRQKYAIVEHD